MTTATAATSDFEMLKRQHEAYFPIVNDPFLLAEYILDFFGPEGVEPIFSQHSALEVRNLLFKCCDRWNTLIQTQGRQALFVEDGGDYSTVSEDDLGIKVNLVLQVIEVPEHLLGYISRVFGPTGPDGLAIKYEQEWAELDDLFLCRMPYPTGFSDPALEFNPQSSQGLYRRSYAKGELVESVTVPPVHCAKSESDLVGHKPPSALSLYRNAYAKGELVESVKAPPAHCAKSVAHLVEVEVVSDSKIPPSNSSRTPSAMEIASWCAVGAGALVLGGFAIKAIGKVLASPAGAALVDELVTSALMDFSSAAREVFVGPRGGKYTVTANGTKSYNAP